MKKLILLSTILIFLSLALTSAHSSYLKQSSTSAERWYDKHKLGYDPNPPDRLIIYNHAYPSYHAPKIIRNYQTVYVRPPTVSIRIDHRTPSIFYSAHHIY